MSRRPALAALVAVALCASLAACSGAAGSTSAAPVAAPAARTSTDAASTAPDPGAPGSPSASVPSPGPTAESPSATPTTVPSTGIASRTPFVSRYVHSIATKDRVVFITIDDGVYADPAFLAFMKKTHLPVTVFLTAWVAKGTRLAYFQELARNGAVIENHTLHHPDLTKVSATARKDEICKTNAKYQALFGHRPTLLRPPFGAQNASVLAAAKACGIHAVVGWNVVQDVTGPLQSSHGRQKLMPGDIIIFHFQPGLNARLQKVLSIIKAQHLKVALLEDYLGAAPA